MRTSKVLKSMTAAAALLALPGTLLAQDMDAEGFDEETVMTGMPTVDLEADVGAAFPVGELGAFTDVGLGVGVGGAFWVHDNVAIRADGDFANLTGDDPSRIDEAITPGMQLYHYGVGVEFDIPGRTSPSAWDFEVNFGVGGTTMDTEDFLDNVGEDEPRDITKTYPNVNAGLVLGHQVTENIVLGIRTQAFWTFIDDVDMQPLAELRARDDLTKGVTVPLTFSLRWDIPSGPRGAMGN